MAVPQENGGTEEVAARDEVRWRVPQIDAGRSNMHDENLVTDTRKTVTSMPQTSAPTISVTFSRDERFFRHRKEERRKSSPISMTTGKN